MENSKFSWKEMKQNIEIRDRERNEKEQNPKLKEGFFQALSE